MGSRNGPSAFGPQLFGSFSFESNIAAKSSGAAAKFDCGYDILAAKYFAAAKKADIFYCTFIYMYIYIYNGSVIQYWRSCTLSRSIECICAECVFPGLNATLSLVYQLCFAL